jgi:hypothetical protein
MKIKTNFFSVFGKIGISSIEVIGCWFGISTNTLYAIGMNFRHF